MNLAKKISKDAIIATDTELRGYVHSVETCSAVDGPGLRFVMFTQGCQLRCLYCHNPDSWAMQQGQSYTVNEMLSEIIPLAPYFKTTGGGVTASGGEALLQAKFLLPLFRKLKEHNLHTCIDTSGFIKYDTDEIRELLSLTDMVLLDIKHIDQKEHIKLTKVSNKPILAFAHHLNAINKPVRVRHVILPGINDDEKYLKEMAEFLAPMENVEKVELLPFHKMGEYKWERLGVEYSLGELQEPSKERVAEIANFLIANGVNATY